MYQVKLVGTKETYLTLRSRDTSVSAGTRHRALLPA